MDEYIYYCEAADELNKNWEKYTDDFMYPSVWRDLVNQQTDYYIILDQLCHYIFDNNSDYILNDFSKSCEVY